MASQDIIFPLLPREHQVQLKTDRNKVKGLSKSKELQDLEADEELPQDALTLVQERQGQQQKQQNQQQEQAQEDSQQQDPHKKKGTQLDTYA